MTGPELVVAPDIETALVQHLQSVFDDRGDTARVVTELPEERPDRLVLLYRAGGPRRNRVTDAPVIIAQFWDMTDIAACELGRLSEGLLLAVDGLFIGDPPVWIEDVGITGGLAYFPDPDTTLPRYQLTAQLLTNCEVL